MKKKCSLMGIVVLGVCLFGCGINQPLPNSPQNRPPVPTDPNQVLLRMMQQRSLNKAMRGWSREEKPSVKRVISCDEIRYQMATRCQPVEKLGAMQCRNETSAEEEKKDFWANYWKG